MNKHWPGRQAGTKGFLEPPIGHLIAAPRGSEKPGNVAEEGTCRGERGEVEISHLLFLRRRARLDLRHLCLKGDLVSIADITQSFNIGLSSRQLR